MQRILKHESFLKNYLLKLHRNYKHEDIGFVGATLARMRNKVQNLVEEKENSYFPSDGN